MIAVAWDYVYYTSIEWPCELTKYYEVSFGIKPWQAGTREL